MTAVWTAMSLQRRDGSSNSLSRSLGSLMSPGNVDDYSTVMLHSNMVASSSASHSRWSVGDHSDEGTDLDTAHSRHVQTPLPKLQKILTDSASSIMFLGKRILREYQSVFVLPDKQQVFVRRNEVFMPEDAVSEVTLSMAVSAPSEVRSFSAEKQVRRRVQEFLENDDWKSAMLASSESRDAELLGYMNSRYSNSTTRRSKLERSESRRRRQEIVKARELYSDDEEGEVQFSSDEELAEKPSTDPSLERRIISPPRTISPEPLLPDRVGRSAPILPPRAPHFRAPIIARSDTPGKRNVLESNEQTKKKFEEIRRRWDERIAMEQFHSQEQLEGAGGQSISSTSLYNEGHRGTAITSILPKTDRREKYAESAQTQNTRTLPPISPQSDHDLRSGPHYFLNRTNTLPDTDIKSGLPGATRYGGRQMVPSPTYSEPFTEREEKETRFSYSQTRLKVGQEKFGQLGLNPEGHSPTRLNKAYAALRTQSLDRSIVSRVSYEASCTIESIPFRLSTASRPRYSARLHPDSHQASMSLNVDRKPRLYMDSKFKQNYIYRTTLSRLPVTVKHFRARSHSATETTESDLTEGDRSTQLAERYFTLSRQPTLLIDWQSVRQKSRTLPPRLTTKATVCLRAPTTSSETTSRKHYVRSESNQEQLTIHITDQQETIVHRDLLTQSTSLRRRPASAEPRTTSESPHVLSPTRARKALLVYPQPSGAFNWKSPLTESVSPSLVCTDQQGSQPGNKSDIGLPSVTTDEEFDAVSPAYSRLHRIDREHDPYTPFPSHHTHPSVPVPPVDHRTAQETAKDLWYRSRYGRVPFVDHKESFVRRPARARSSPSYATDQYPDEETHYTSMGETKSVPKRQTSKPVEPTKSDDHRHDYNEDESSKQQERFRDWNEIRQKGKEEAASSTEKLLDKTQLKFFDEDRGYKPKYEDDTFTRHPFLKDSPLKSIGQASYFFPHDSVGPGESYTRKYSKNATTETNYIDYFLAPTPYRVKEWGSKQWVSVPTGAKSAAEDKPTVPFKLPSHSPPTSSSVAIKRSASVQDSRYKDSLQPKGRRILRRKSDLDQNLEEQFDRVYREELSRRESKKIDRVHTVDQCSSSDLSVLASREEDDKELRRTEGKRRALSASRSSESGGKKVNQPYGIKTYSPSAASSGDKKPVASQEHPTSKSGFKKSDNTDKYKLSMDNATTYPAAEEHKPFTTSVKVDVIGRSQRKAARNNDINKTDPFDQRWKSEEAVRPTGIPEDDQWDLEHRTGKADRPHQETARRQSRTGDGAKSAEGVPRDRPGVRDPHAQQRSSGAPGEHEKRVPKSGKRHKDLSETERTESFRKDSRGSVISPNEPASAPGHSDSGDRKLPLTTNMTDPSLPHAVGDVQEKRRSGWLRGDQQLHPPTSKSEEATGRTSERLHHPVGPQPVQPPLAEDVEPCDLSDPANRYVDRIGKKWVDKNSLRNNTLKKTKYSQDTDIAASKQVKRSPDTVQQPNKTHVKPIDSKIEHEPDKARGASKRFSSDDVKSPHRGSKLGDMGDELTKWPVAHHKSYDPLAPINVTRGKTNEEQTTHEGDSERTSRKKMLENSLGSDEARKSTDVKKRPVKQDDQSTRDDSKRVGRKRHPPPPTSPPYQRSSRTNVEDPNDYLPVLHAEDPGASMCN
ncbi:hypothetical protein P879_00163 [Paragonimus westermani]|uniref:Uncharacterized protein n=1 Tax=Paragonimus westermani TaxID=34504 RepID=A0A8T0DW81_9TREM|nr:hypothetical protein P879_00163 [Paragonimus westermani]